MDRGKCKERDSLCLQDIIKNKKGQTYIGAYHLGLTHSLSEKSLRKKRIKIVSGLQQLDLSY